MHSQYRNPWFTTAVVLFVVIACVWSCARADWYLSLGQSTFSPKGTGIWFVNELPHELNNKHLSGTLGYAFQPTSWLDMRLGYVDHGRIQTDALAYWPDEAYAKGRGKYGCATDPCVPANRYTTSATSRGVEFVLEPTYRFGDWSVGGGYGFAVLHTDLRGCVQNGEGPNPFAPGGYQFATRGCFPRDSAIGGNHWSNTPVLTASVGYSRFFLRYSSYPAASASGGSSYQGIRTVELGAHWSF